MCAHEWEYQHTPHMHVISTLMTTALRCQHIPIYIKKSKKNTICANTVRQRTTVPVDATRI